MNNSIASVQVNSKACCEQQIALLHSLPMKQEPKSLQAWQLEDAAKLKKLFENRKERLSQEAFGSRYEIGSQGMVWQYLNGHRPLNIAAATAFAKGLDVTIEEFSPTLAGQVRDAFEGVAAKPMGRPVRALEDSDPGVFKIRMLEQVQLRAGITGLAHESLVEDGAAYSIDRGWAFRKGFFPEDLVAVMVTGRSMEPTIHEGDIAIINTADRRPVAEAVFAVNNHGEPVIKRIRRHEHFGSWLLCSDNEDQKRYKPEVCRGDDCLFVGKVVQVHKDRI